MSKLTWDGVGEKEFEVGVSKGVLYTFDSENNKWVGVAWNGLTNVTESPEGGDAEKFYADNQLYASIRGNEDFSGSIECFTYPKEFEACIGHAEAAPGVYIGQQSRKVFCLCYRSEIGNDTNPEAGYKLHIVYNCTANAPEMSHDTTEDSVSLEPMSFDYDSTPVQVTGHKPTSSVTINSLTVPKAKLTTLEDALYGTTEADAYLPLADALIGMLKVTGTNP